MGCSWPGPPPCLDTRTPRPSGRQPAATAADTHDQKQGCEPVPAHDRQCGASPTALPPQGTSRGLSGPKPPCRWLPKTRDPRRHVLGHVLVSTSSEHPSTCGSVPDMRLCPQHAALSPARGALSRVWLCSHLAAPRSLAPAGLETEGRAAGPRLTWGGGAVRSARLSLKALAG